MKAILLSFFSRSSVAVALGAVLGCAQTAQLSASINCATPPSGLVAWWRAEDDAADSAGGNHGALYGVGFAPGMVGQAFSIAPRQHRVRIPDSEAFKLTDSLTIEGWVNVAGDGGIIFIRSDSTPGLDPYMLTMDEPGRIAFYIQSLTDVAKVTAPIAYGQWVHVAATLDGASGDMRIYTDGVLADQTNTTVRPLGDLHPARGAGIGIGNTAELSNDFNFNGLIDEISLYSRALSQVEIEAIYQAGTAGKCVPVPPLVCVPAPDGLVSWWRGEGDATDTADGNNGSLAGNAAFGPGAVGQALVLDGNGDGVQLGNPANLQLQNFTIELWVKRADPTRATVPLIYINGALLHYGNQGYGFCIHNDGRLLLTKVGVSAVYSSALRVTDTEFHHVAVTKDGSTVRFYVDGVAEAAPAYDPGFVFNTPVAIGARGGDLAASFWGTIDELAVYGRVLSEAEIQAIHNAGTAGKCVPVPPPPPPVCVPAPDGLVSWWRGEGNGDDTVSGREAVLINGATFEPGKVGQGFSLNGVNQYARVPATAALRLTKEFTLEFWYKQMVSGNYSFMAKRDPGAGVGPCNFGFNVYNGTMFLYFLDSALPGFRGATHPAPSIGAFHHLAGSYRQVDADNVELRIYVDGQLATTQRVAGNLSRSVNTNVVTIGTDGFFLNGIIDEVSIYSRALLESEVQAIYDAGSLGKCLVVMPPAVTLEPTNQTTVVGRTVTFTATAIGTPPLSYQWRKEGLSLSGATTAALVLTNVQLADAGTYSVVVSNAAGTATSAEAVLRVNPLVCAPVPDGLVAWWRGEGDALDQVGGHNGVLMGGVTFAPGVVGQGFQFNGLDSYVQIPHHPALSLSNELTVELWYRDEGSVGWYALIAKRTAASPSNYGLHVQAGGGQGVELFFFDQTLGGFSVSDYVPIPASGVFHHLAGTFRQVDAGHVELGTYVDGELVKTAVVSGNLGKALNEQPVTLGAELGNAMADFFKGVMDEVAVYNRALSPAEIKAIYDAGSLGKCLPPVNQPPVADASATTPLLIVAAGCPRTVLLDGSRSSDPDGDALQYLWFKTGDTTPLATGAVATVTLPLGVHELTLVVNDGLATDSDAVSVTVLSARQAVQRLITQVNESGIRHSRPLVALLSAAADSLRRHHPRIAIIQLRAFQHLVQVAVHREDPALAAEWIRAAERVIEALSQECALSCPPWKFGKLRREGCGPLRLEFAGPARQGCVVEASTNLVDWEVIGPARESEPGVYEFEDAAAAALPARFYRIVDE